MNKPAFDLRPDTKPGFTAADYLRMEALGAFSDMRVELVDGELRKMMPSSLAHGEMNSEACALIREAYRGTGLAVAVDLMIDIGERTIRGADVAVVSRAAPRGGPVSAEHIVLLVEVAATMLPEDLGPKRAEYATIGVPHYWVIDVDGRAIHLMSDPEGDNYRARSVVPFGQPVSVPGVDRTITIEQPA